MRCASCPRSRWARNMHFPWNALTFLATALRACSLVLWWIDFCLEFLIWSINCILCIKKIFIQISIQAKTVVIAGQGACMRTVRKCWSSNLRNNIICFLQVQANAFSGSKFVELWVYSIIILKQKYILFVKFTTLLVKNRKFRCQIEQKLIMLDPRILNQDFFSGFFSNIWKKNFMWKNSKKCMLSFKVLTHHQIGQCSTLL